MVFLGKVTVISLPFESLSLYFAPVDRAIICIALIRYDLCTIQNPNLLSIPATLERQIQQRHDSPFTR